MRKVTINPNLIRRQRQVVYLDKESDLPAYWAKYNVINIIPDYRINSGDQGFSEMYYSEDGEIIICLLVEDAPDSPILIRVDGEFKKVKRECV